jgi:hypothetical protein
MKEDSVGYFSGFGVWVDCYRGAPGCWEFWARGQESSQNPGAREPRQALFLAGREEDSVLGRILGKAAERTTRDREFSIRRRYVDLCIFMNMWCYVMVM